MQQNKKKLKQATVVSEKSSIGFSVFSIRIMIALFAIVLYIQSVGFEFTLDDDIFYQKHESVQKGLAGFTDFFSYGSMNKFDGSVGVQPYRPFTLLSFAIDKQMFDNSASSSHFVNVLLYILIVQLLYTLLFRLFPDVHRVMLAFIALLFLVHPVHSEVVSSIKSRDELLAALFGFMAWIKFLPSKKVISNNSARMISAALFLLFAMFSKESAIAFVVILPLSYFMFVDKKVKPIIIKSLPLLLSAAIYLLMRQFAMYNGIGTPHTMKIPTLDNVLAGSTSIAQTFATKMEILFYYVKLLFIPWPLSWDYSFNQIPLVSWTDILPWMGLIIYACLIFVAIIYFTKKPEIAFAILFYFITSLPTNNLLLMNGATLAERFMFVPSFAFALAVVFVLSEIFNIKLSDFSGVQKKMFTRIVFVVLFIFSGMSVVRCGDWKNNFSLFESGAENAPKSSRTNAALGSEYMNLAEKENDVEVKNELIQKSIKYYKKSLDIFPDNSDASYKVGLIFSMISDTANAIKYYKMSLAATPGQIFALNNLGSIYASNKEYDSAAIYFTRSYEADSSNEMTITNLEVVNYLRGNDDECIYYGNRALQLQIKTPKVYQLLSQAWSRKGNNEMASKYSDLINTNNKLNFNQ